LAFLLVESVRRCQFRSFVVIEITRNPDKTIKFLVPGAINARFASMKQGLTAAMLVSPPQDFLAKKMGFVVLARSQRQIVDLATKTRLPAMYGASGFVEAGGLISYAANFAERFHRAATYVDKILKGAKPADLPVEQPTKFEFVINLKAAKQIGLTIPSSVLYRADKIIK